LFAVLERISKDTVVAHWGTQGEGAAGLYPPAQSEIKKTDFVDIMLSEMLRDLHCSLNQPMKSAGEKQYNTSSAIKSVIVEF
jgi:hypothetical protein